MAPLILGPIRSVFLLGGGPLLLEFLKWILGEGARCTVITAERHAQERMPGKDKTFGKVLEEINVQHFVVADINDAKTCSKMIAFDQESIALSFGAAWVFKPLIIKTIFQNRLFNLHGTRLPQHRGAGAFSWQILRGSRLGFCLIHQIDGGIDTGDILAYEEFLYPVSCRIPTDYEAYYREKNLAFLKEIFIKLIRETVSFETISQTEYFSMYWPRLHSPTHSWMDWSLPVELVDRFICAFDDPYYGAQTMWRACPVRVKKSIPDYSDGSFHPFQYGMVYRNNGRWICVAANGGTIILQSVVDKDENEILGKIRVGDRFFTPQENLENAAKKRIIYTAQGVKITE